MTINELREKRAQQWEAAKNFLNSHRTEKGTLTAEDDASYTAMEQEIADLGKEIARMERQEALDAELAKPVNKPITAKPMSGMSMKEDEKMGRASDDYKKNFWNVMRTKAPMPQVMNALQEGTDSEAATLCLMNSSILWWKHLRKRTSSVRLPISFRRSLARERFLWLPPRAAPTGLMRKALM